MAWAIEHESQLDEFFNNSFPGRLFLMSRMFDKEISEVKRQMKEAEYKHTIKQFCLKENSVTLKHLTEDLSGVCDVQEEVDGRDEGTTYSMGSSTQKPQKVEDDGSSEEITYPFWGLTENPKKEEEDESSEDSSFTVGSPPENLGEEENHGSSEEITCPLRSLTEHPKRECCEEDDGSSDKLGYPLCSSTETPKKSRQQILCERSEFMRKRATAYNFKPLTSSLDATGLDVTTGRDIPARPWGPDCLWMNNRQYGRDKGDRRYAGNGGGRRHGDSDPTEGFGDGDYTINGLVS
ncbi:hypothetical protein MAR_036126 [Mya arenaria]|uniref:Uncharacterized protein n=1 Tax=Mya arenaria TaxID=6604 RepID=A0ABY7EP87_MYAAR|nr:hypothetical protein MAR_036126 [Mya arenaria]